MNSGFRAFAAALVALSIVAAPGASVPAFAQDTVSQADADRYLGHAQYIELSGAFGKAWISDRTSDGADLVRRVQAQLMTVDPKQSLSSPELKELRSKLAAAQQELNELHSQLGRSLVTQDTSLAVLMSVGVLGLTSLAGRFGIEGVEKAILGLEIATPDQANGWMGRLVNGSLRYVNGLMTKVHGALDKVGKVVGRISLVAFGVGSVGSFVIFYLERDEVQDFANRVQASLAGVERLMAQIDYIEKGAVKK